MLYNVYNPPLLCQNGQDPVIKTSNNRLMQKMKMFTNAELKSNSNSLMQLVKQLPIYCRVEKMG